MKPSNSFTSYGKWILAGEHSVLRGAPALVFPHRNCTIAFDFDITNSDSSSHTDKKSPVRFTKRYGQELESVFWRVAERALQVVGKQRSDLKGLLSLTSRIPIGTGLGASATICVTIGRWFFLLGWIQKDDIYEFSRQLEHLFHGESSGMDIAAAMSTEGLKFVKEGPARPIKVNWKPQWFLSYCGQLGRTSECTFKVKSLWEKTPDLGRRIDGKMRESVELAESALSLSREEEGLNPLAKAIDLARSCFHLWGLDEGKLGKHMEDLLSQGALAVKPTGSGGGGYVLSLWKSSPPEVLKKQFLVI